MTVDLIMLSALPATDSQLPAALHLPSLEVLTGGQGSPAMKSLPNNLSIPMSGYCFSGKYLPGKCPISCKWSSLGSQVAITQDMPFCSCEILCQHMTWSQERELLVMMGLC